MDGKRIMCPIDFSEYSQEALQCAAKLASDSGATLFIVHVESASTHYKPGDPAYVPELDHHRQLLETLPPQPDRVKYEHHCLRGEPAHEILRFAILRKIDHIFVGTHGRTGLAKFLMGSVAESIVNNASCEVTTVPRPTNSTIKVVDTNDD